MKSINIKVTRDEKAWEAEVQADIPADALAGFRAQALRSITQEVELDGFRKGKAPENLVLQRVGEAAVLREAAQLAVQEELPEILAKENLPIVDTPQVTTGQPEIGKDLHFVARAPLAPTITLPDYKKIAAAINAEKKEVVVTDEEHADTLTHFRREKVRVEKIEGGMKPEEAKEHSTKLDTKELPELDDTFVKPFGFENVSAFHDAVRENLKNEKTVRETETQRAKILDAIVAKAEVKYPAMLREFEKDEMQSRIESDLQRMGTTFENYLAQTKKTVEDLRKEWEEPADKRAKTRLLLSEIARAEKVLADEHKVEHELEHAVKHYPSANKDTLKMNIAHALKNEAVIEFLEAQK